MPADTLPMVFAVRLGEPSVTVPAVPSSSPEDALEPALRAVLVASDAAAGAICLYDETEDVLRLVMGQGLRPLALGLGLGLVAAIGLAQLVSRLLYGIDPTDPMCFAGSLAVLVIVGVTACLLPARRAVALEPVRALRAL